MGDQRGRAEGDAGAGGVVLADAVDVGEVDVAGGVGGDAAGVEVAARVEDDRALEGAGGVKGLHAGVEDRREHPRFDPVADVDGAAVADRHFGEAVELAGAGALDAGGADVARSGGADVGAGALVDALAEGEDEGAGRGEALDPVVVGVEYVDVVVGGAGGVVVDGDRFEAEGALFAELAGGGAGAAGLANGGAGLELVGGGVAGSALGGDVPAEGAEEGAGGIENVDAVVVGVGDVDVAGGVVDGDALGAGGLGGGGALGAEGEVGGGGRREKGEAGQRDEREDGEEAYTTERSLRMSRAVRHSLFSFVVGGVVEGVCAEVGGVGIRAGNPPAPQGADGFVPLG